MLRVRGKSLDWEQEGLVSYIWGSGFQRSLPFTPVMRGLGRGPRTGPPDHSAFQRRSPAQ